MRRTLPILIVLWVGHSAVWAGGEPQGRPSAPQFSVPSCAALVEGDPNRPTTRPFLKVLAFSDPGLPVVPAPVSEVGTLLCHDQGMLRIELSAVAAERSQVPFLAAVSTGRVTPAAWRELTEAVAVARIGRVKSCRPDSVPGAVRAEITWYGRGTRTNTFFLSSGDFSLPACSIAVDDLWRALQQPAFDAESKSVVILASAVPAVGGEEPPSSRDR